MGNHHPFTFKFLVIAKKKIATKCIGYQYRNRNSMVVKERIDPSFFKYQDMKLITSSQAWFGGSREKQLQKHLDIDNQNKEIYLRELGHGLEILSLPLVGLVEGVGFPLLLVFTKLHKWGRKRMHSHLDMLKPVSVTRTKKKKATTAES